MQLPMRASRTLDVAITCFPNSGCALSSRAELTLSLLPIPHSHSISHCLYYCFLLLFLDYLLFYMSQTISAQKTSLKRRNSTRTASVIASTAITSLYCHTPLKRPRLSSISYKSASTKLQSSQTRSSEKGMSQSRSFPK